MSKFDPVVANVEVAPEMAIDALRAMRTHLGMEIGYLSEFVDDHLVFRAVDAPGLEHLAAPGEKLPLSDTYCNHILSGALPQMMADTLDHPVATALPITHDMPIRAHVSVPIERRDGSVYGMFCCLSPRPNTTLNDRDLDLMRSFARLAQAEVQREIEVKTRRRAASDAIKSIVSNQAFELVYQPIFNLQTGAFTGAEALCRFKSQPYRPPNLWFDDAAEVGLGEMLEICVMEPAIATLKRLPKGAYLSLNASPHTVSTGLLAPIFEKPHPKGIVLEVTEHNEVVDWTTLSRELHHLRELGVMIAIDDAGAGYSGLHQMVRLQPDIIKLDRALVEQIDEDPARRSLCAAMVHYATEMDAILVAEGIERVEEMNVLRDLGVHRAQGYLLARPMGLEQLLELYGVP